MNTLQFLENEISYYLEYLDKMYEYCEVDQDGRLYDGYVKRFGSDKYDTFIDRDVYDRDHEFLVELRNELEHRKKMLNVLTKVKTFVEVKSLQKSDILNNDVNIVIAGYLTGISSKPIEKQLRLF